MGSNRHRRDDMDVDRDRHRDRHRNRDSQSRTNERGRHRERHRHQGSRSRSRSTERYHRRRRSYSRSRSRSIEPSSSRPYSSRDKRSNRYSSQRQSESRSRSRSYSRSHRRSRTPTNRRSRSNDQRTETSTQEQTKDTTDKREDRPAHEFDPDNGSSSVNSVEDLPLPKKETVGSYYNLDTDEPIDKEKIHREMEEKLRATLAKEGKVYPPPKPEASHPVFANDGSFLEIFKKMQQAQQAPSAAAPLVKVSPLESTSAASAYVAATASGKPAPPPPIVGRRRGGKILKTGMVAKPKAQGEDTGDPKDFWSIYLREVNKYKNNACDTDGGTRPLVK